MDEIPQSGLKSVRSHQPEVMGIGISIIHTLFIILPIFNRLLSGSGLSAARLPPPSKSSVAVSWLDFGCHTANVPWL